MKKRSEEEIRTLITKFANDNERVKAVLLNGSRANKNVAPDPYQDFDIVFIVTDFGSFTNDHTWTNIFGEKIIEQLPDEVTFDKMVPPSISFTYLMLFKDGNRVDLTLFPVEKFKTDFIPESLSIVWLDKDGLFDELPAANDSDHYIKQPTQKDFSDTCNEFWWVSTYVAKGLKRNQLLYAKEMMETVVRPMFMKMIAWKISAQNNFSVNAGKSGKFFQQYLSKEDYSKILETYANAGIANNWQSLFNMTNLFSIYAKEIAEVMKFVYNIEEENNTKEYLGGLYKDE